MHIGSGACGPNQHYSIIHSGSFSDFLGQVVTGHSILDDGILVFKIPRTKQGKRALGFHYTTEFHLNFMTNGSNR
jgi:hypothetical protein